MIVRTLSYGGEGGSRTRDTLARIHDFQSCSFGHSDTSPVKFNTNKYINNSKDFFLKHRFSVVCELMALLLLRFPYLDYPSNLFG
jgi:hypothetical protein